MLDDPLTQVIGLLQPSARFSKLATAAGRWAVRPPGAGPFYAAILEGACELSIAGNAAIRLGGGDFILIPAARDFMVTSLEPPPTGYVDEPAEVHPGVFHLGEPGDPDTQLLVGYCAFGSDDAALLVSLLPDMVVVRRERRLTLLVELLSEEARADRPGRDVVLARLLEVLLIEAFRATNRADRRAGSAARLRGRAPRCGAAADARRADTPLDGGRTGEGGRAVTVHLFRAVPPRGRHRTDGVSAWMADGLGQGHAAERRLQCGRCRTACGLRFLQRVQCRVHTSGGHVTDSVCPQLHASCPDVAPRSAPIGSGIRTSGETTSKGDAVKIRF